MASVSKLQQTKDGRRYWIITVSRGYGKTPYRTRFYWPTKKDTSLVAQSTAEAARDRFTVEYESQCKAGKIFSRAERKAIDEEEARRAEEEARRAALEAAKIKTFRQYSVHYMREKKITCAEKTRRYYQNALDHHLLPRFGDVPLQDISAKDLTDFFLDLQKPDENTGKKLAHNTIIGIYRTANQLFKMAYNDDTISRNPLDKVKRPRQKKDDKHRTDPERYTKEEVKEIKRCLENEPMKWQALVHILLATGMRRGEVCALTWDKIDFKNMVIVVDRALNYTPEKGLYYEKPKTEAGDRVVPMSNELAGILRQYKAAQVEAVKKRTERLKKDHKVVDITSIAEYQSKIKIPENLFTAKGSSDPMHPDSVNRYFSRFEKEYGIDDFHPHKLRHTAISIMLENGIPVVPVAAIVGHKDAYVTYKTYAHASEEGMKAAIESLANSTRTG